MLSFFLSGKCREDLQAANKDQAEYIQAKLENNESIHVSLLSFVFITVLVKKQKHVGL